VIVAERVAVVGRANLAAEVVWQIGVDWVAVLEIAVAEDSVAAQAVGEAPFRVLIAVAALPGAPANVAVPAGGASVAAPGVEVAVVEVAVVEVEAEDGGDKGRWAVNCEQ